MEKTGTLRTVTDLAESFNDKFTSLAAEKTRERRRQRKAPIQYQIADDTNIKHIPLTQFLSLEKTKADLTDYLAKATLDYKIEFSLLLLQTSSFWPWHTTTSSAKVRRFRWLQVWWILSQFGELWEKKRRKLYLYSTHSLERTMLENSQEWANTMVSAVNES